MILSSRTIAILRERKKRGISATMPVDPAVTSAAAAKLRAWMHPTQRAFFLLGPARWRATKKTRRSGATSGGVREFLARAIETPGWRGTYATKTLKNSRKIAWENDSKSGFVDILREVGTHVDHPTLEAWSLGGVLVEVRDAALILDFSNGSQIEMYGADSVKRQSDARGYAKNVFWLDEAQDFPELETFFDRVALAALSDTSGHCWLTGTPGVDCAGLFFEITKEEEHERLPNWDVHILMSTHNPFFGAVIQADVGYFVQDNLGARTGPYDTRAEAEAAAVRVRWDRTAGDAMLAKNWKGDEPDFVREWLGKWVRSDARYVYPVHAVAEHLLVYAPQRLRDNPINAEHPRWYDHQAALRDLPQPPRGVPAYQWLFGVGVDFGYWPDPFAVVVFAFCYSLVDVFEMFSWKMTKVNTDEQGLYLKALWTDIDSIVSFVGDAAGKQDDFEVWQSRLNVPIDEANKQGKNTLEAFLADDVRGGRVHFRGDPPVANGERRVLSPVLTEMQHLVYLPGKPGKTREVDKHRKVAGVVHGDHNCFVAHTKVELERGPVDIEHVRPGDLALTRAGLRPVTAAFSVGTKPTWRLEASNGRSLIGTGDHPIWTQRGWVPLQDLMPSDTLTGWESTDRARPWCSTGTDTGAILSPSIGPRASTSCEPSSAPGDATQSRCTERHGNTCSVRCRPDTTCTMPTETPSTTHRETSPSGAAPITCASMPQPQSESGCRERASPRPLLRHRHGTGQRPGLRGILPTVCESLPSGPSSRPDANGATQSSPPSSQPRGSAATTARPQHDEQRASMTSIGYADSAIACSEPTGTAPRGVAPVRVRSVVATGMHERVYNLTVAGDHEYFANGLLVSNCDAARYLYNDLRHYLAKPPEPKPEPGSIKAIEAMGEHEERGLERARLEEELEYGELMRYNEGGY